MNQLYMESFVEMSTISRNKHITIFNITVCGKYPSKKNITLSEILNEVNNLHYLEILSYSSVDNKISIDVSAKKKDTMRTYEVVKRLMDFICSRHSAIESNSPM